MAEMRGRRPSPSLVISLLALFVALGGSAYAMSKVGTKDIKKNAITTRKIKNNAVTTSKIKNDAVTGAKVQEATLGAVPEARHADSAADAVHAHQADSAANAANATNFSRFGTTGVITNSFDNEELQPVADGPGPFSFESLCVDSDGDQAADTVYATISSSVAGAFVYSPGSDASGGLKKANTSVPISPIVVSKKSWGKEMSEFTASTPDGSLILRGFVEVGTQVFGGECAYDISWFEVQ